MYKLRSLTCCILLYVIFTVFIFYTNYSYGAVDDTYVWSNYSESISTSNPQTSSNNVNLALESGSAILVEQTTR